MTNGVFKHIEQIHKNAEISSDSLNYHFYNVFGRREEKEKVEAFLDTQAISDAHLLENIIKPASIVPINKELEEQIASLSEDESFFLPIPYYFENVLFKNGMEISIKASGSLNCLPNKPINPKLGAAMFSHFEVMAYDKTIIEPYFEQWQAFIVDSDSQLYYFVPKKLIELTLAKADEKFGIVRDLKER